jgi:hypothetical protein
MTLFLSAASAARTPQAMINGEAIKFDSGIGVKVKKRLTA